jgi:hypothetical protein
MKSDEILIKTFDQVKNDNFDQVKFDQVIVCPLLVLKNYKSKFIKGEIQNDWTFAAAAATANHFLCIIAKFKQDYRVAKKLGVGIGLS